MQRPAVYLQCNTEIDCSVILFNTPSSLTSFSLTISRLLQNTQYFAKIYKGKSEKEYIDYVYTYYTHVHNNYFAVHLTLTQHCISTILQFKIKVFKRSWFLEAVALLFGEGNGNPLQDSCLENPMDRGAW